MNFKQLYDILFDKDDCCNHTPEVIDVIVEIIKESLDHTNEPIEFVIDRWEILSKGHSGDNIIYIQYATRVISRGDYPYIKRNLQVKTINFINKYREYKLTTLLQ